MARVDRSLPTKPIDTLVVGAGVGGLACAARLALRGQHVLVLDQHFLPGGYCTSFHRQGYTFDACIDTLGGAAPGSQFRRILEACEVLPRVKLRALDPIRENVFGDPGAGGFSVKVPASMDAYEALLAGRYPRQQPGLHELFATLRELLQGQLMVPVETIWEGGGFERVFPALARWRRATWRDLMVAHLDDEELMSVLSERCSYVGLPPSRVSALSMAAMLVTYFEGGTWRVEGGYQRLADGFVDAIRTTGSRVVLGVKVEKLMVEGGRVVGVALADGREVRAKRVVSNADARATLLQMLGRAHLPADVADAISAPRAALSFVVVHLGLKRDLSSLPFASSIGYFPGGSVERSFAFERPISDDPDLAMGIIVPTNEDKGLAPSGGSILSIHYLCPHGMVEDWSAQKESIARDLVRRAERLIPDLLAHAELVSVATPYTMWRYTLNEQGAAYGFEQSPERFAVLKELRRSLPPGLHLCGHWTDWGGGVVAATCSGFEEARRILSAQKKVRRAAV
jgi:phytoene dehydrogenase-like protein